MRRHPKQHPAQNIISLLMSALGERAPGDLITDMPAPPLFVSTRLLPAEQQQPRLSNELSCALEHVLSHQGAGLTRRKHESSAQAMIILQLSFVLSYRMTRKMARNSSPFSGSLTTRLLSLAAAPPTYDRFSRPGPLQPSPVSSADPPPPPPAASASAA